MDTTKSDVPPCCDRCDSLMHPGAVEDDYGEFVCAECDQAAAERAYERMCEDFHDGSCMSFPDGERKRMEEARKLK